MAIRALAGIGLGVALLLTTRVALPADDTAQTIRGTIAVDPALAQHLEPGDRLIIKLFHPGNGVELDAKYNIVDRFTLPLEFAVSPAIDMAGRTKFQAYVIEIFTDKNGDVLGVAPGELQGTTPEPVALGTTGLTLELAALRE